ncbi:SIS domain-containing protein [Streptomonospora salina]|uniref:Glucosamine--fructose-6-phosphate aminotransferase (Isomerizing) n=1 Tax=Streptomonospora salina TaxID=104205 RepID=A0A841E5B2_9ACTN|nr:SIS domain-containing protein [Streptomonospora salina]MBB5997644.1 glucosamine--fructose-6-phosphate aminotransferase (isomerizing) [Streptomonospora salina]
MTTTTSFMRSEIAEQPDALRATLDTLLPLIPEIAALGRQTRQVLFIARGSSDNAAVYGSYLIQAHSGRLATLASPSIATTYGAKVDLTGVLAVAISQSGRTEEIVDTMAWAADCGARTIGITNGADSPLTRTADIAMVTRAGGEHAVPATKTYTTQLAALAVLALGLGAGLDRTELETVPDAIDRVLARPGDEVDAIVERLVGVQGAVVSGRGMAFSTALEAALKLKEACYLHAMGLSYADLLHGPIAVVDRATPALLTAANSGPTLDGTVALAERVSAAGAPVYAVGGGSALAGACDLSVPMPDLPEWLAPIALIVPAQQITERLARSLGYDPDSPRGLGKVTQT